jgi:hypoxanthine phosphoribosyltransferase
MFWFYEVELIRVAFLSYPNLIIVFTKRIVMLKQLPPELARVLISADEIQARVESLAEQISNDYRDIDQLFVIGILKGAFIFLADLTRKMDIPHVVDFMALSSYGKSTQSGAVRILMDLREPIEGRHVLIVEDIVDTGNTLQYLNGVIRGRSPASLRTCALVRKPSNHLDPTLDYLGFDIPPVWVVGYGLDYAEKFRTLPFIAELKR